MHKLVLIVCPDDLETSGYSYPRVDVIWIDVYPIGETGYTQHIRTHDKPYVVSFHVYPTKSGGFYCSWEKGFLSQSPAWLTNLWVSPRFLSPNSHWGSKWKSIISWQTCYISLVDPYLQHVINTFNTCSRGPTKTRSFINIDGGYHLRGHDCHITLSALHNHGVCRPSIFP
jgi:hypothetical protein